MKRYLLHVLLFLIGTTAVMAESMKIEIIPMQSRMVNDIIPIIKPLLVEGGTVTGMNNQLIVKTIPSNLKQIRSVVSKIDKPPRSLMISVKQDVVGDLDRSEEGLSARYHSGNIRFESPDISGEGSFIRGMDSSGNVIRYRATKNSSRLQDKNVFRIQTVEGSPAYINSGQSVPVPTQTTVITSAVGVVIKDGVEYHDLTSGFYVVPHLAGDIVTLHVSPQFSRINPDQAAIFDVQNIETTVSGKLGEWIAIGEIDRHRHDDSKQNLISSRGSNQEQRDILIKVEEIK